LQWGNAKGEPHTGNPYVRFDEGTVVERPPPTLQVWAFFRKKIFVESFLNIENILLVVAGK
jgi:hypothetical protein